MFIVRILHSTDLGLTAALLNNRPKKLLLYDFIIQSVKYCCNNNDLDDIFTNTSTCVNTNYWSQVRLKVRILAAGKKSLFYDPAISRLPYFSGKFYYKILDLYTSIR